MAQGFAFACQAMKYRNCWLTHEPSTSLADGCEINIHGHLHNFLDKNKNEQEKAAHGQYKARDFHRLFALEYTEYRPVNFDKFVSHPAKYRANIKEVLEKKAFIDRILGQK